MGLVIAPRVAVAAPTTGFIVAPILYAVSLKFFAAALNFANLRSLPIF
jgi:hypothetical protein